MNLFMFKQLIKFFFMPKENVYLYLHLIMLHTILINWMIPIIEIICLL